MSAKIIKLDVQNVMRIKAVHIEPEQNVVIVGGRNAQGKTSVLDSIAMAAGGQKLCPSHPIRDGEDEAKIALTLGDLHVTRTFRREPNGTIRSALTVKGVDGKAVKAPQATLDALIGRLTFDPLEFARMSPAAARETLRELVGLDVEQLEVDLRRAYEDRTRAGQEKRATQAVVDALPLPEPRIAPVEITAEAAQMREAVEAQRKLEGLKGEIARREADRVRLAERSGELKAQRAAIDLDLSNIHQRISDVTGALGTLELERLAVEIPDTSEIEARINAASEHNRRASEIDRAAREYERVSAEAVEKAERWKALDAEHARIEFEIKRRTEAVQYPIEGLELRRDGVYFNGVPFSQASRAERIKVSLAMGIAMNSDLGVLLIRDGSVLDAESLKTVAALAQEHDFQFWIEMARGYEGESGAIIIEDGAVV